MFIAYFTNVKLLKIIVVVILRLYYYSGMKNMSPKQILFAYMYIELGSAFKAYHFAYDTSDMKDITVYSASYQLLKVPRVAELIAKLQAENAERHGVTVEKLAMEYDSAIELSLNLGRTAAAISGIKGKAKLYGLEVDVSEVKNFDVTPWDSVKSEPHERS